PEPTASELIHSIVGQHHRASSVDLTSAAVRVAGAAQSEKVRRIGRLLESIDATLRRHMEREEQELFPRIEQLESQEQRVRAGSISRALLVEFVEHDVVAEWLGKLWELALQLNRDEDPDGELFESLAALHRDLNRHMHAENNVLIPIVVDREDRNKRLASGRDEMRH
ncbi:MAG: hemerythrin domain-containing protein, partial [Thermoanaerobaculia bacterium]